MTRRDYTLIAKVVSELKDRDVRELVCERFITVLDKENGNFNEEKFRTACGRK